MAMKNEPAFPVAYQHDEATAEYHGMTKREYFTALNYAAILSRVICNQDAENMLVKAGIKPADFEAFYAKLAVSGADATLAALEPLP